MKKNVPISTAYDVENVKPFFDALVERMGLAKKCPIGGCQRNKKCSYSPHPFEDMLDNHTRLLLKVGMPICLAVGWDSIRDDIYQALKKSIGKA